VARPAAAAQEKGGGTSPLGPPPTALWRDACRDREREAGQKALSQSGPQDEVPRRTPRDGRIYDSFRIGLTVTDVVALESRLDGVG